MWSTGRRWLHNLKIDRLRRFIENNVIHNRQSSYTDTQGRGDFYKKVCTDSSIFDTPVNLMRNPKIDTLLNLLDNLKIDRLF